MASIVVRFAYSGPEVGILVHAGPKTYSVANLYGLTIEQRIAAMPGGQASYTERWSRDSKTVVLDTESPAFAERMWAVRKMMAEHSELRQKIDVMETLARETYKARVKQAFPEVQ